MKAHVKIVGIGLRKSGTSKRTGKAYDFIPVSIIYQDKDTEGFAAATCPVDPETFHACNVKLNEERDIFYHGFGSNMSIDGII